MTRKTADEIHGREFDWVACDKSGRVALFSTAGGGYPPRALLEDTDAYDRAISLILESPARGVAKVAPKIASGLPNIWKDVADRGLYAFDSDAHGGPYRAVAVPGAPVLLRELSTMIADVVSRVEFTTLDFAVVDEVSMEQILACESEPDPGSS